MPLDQWQALAGLHSGEAQNNLTVSFLPIGAAVSPVVPRDGGVGVVLGQEREGAGAGKE